MIRQAIHQLSNKQDLTTEQAIVSMKEIMSGTASDRNNSFCSSHERKSSKHRL